MSLKTYLVENYDTTAEREIFDKITENLSKESLKELGLEGGSRKIRLESKLLLIFCGE